MAQASSSPKSISAESIPAGIATAAIPRPVSPSHEPIRVLHVITRLIIGGAMENTILTVLGQMRDPRYQVTLFSGIDEGPEGNLHDAARSQGVELVLSRHLVRPIRPIADLKALIELTRFIRAGRFHIVHTHASKAGILGRIAARLAGTPIVVHTLHSLVFHEYQSGLANRFYIALKRLCARLTDQFIAVSESTRRGALRAGIGHPDRYATVVSGMNLTPFLEAERQIDRAVARRRFGLPLDSPVVGKVARLFPLKGHEQFLAMAAQVHRRRGDVHFLLVGDGVLRSELEGKVEAAGMSKVIHFAGLVPPAEIPAALVAMDVVVHTSLREGIARALPQALAVGRPVVTFALDGAAEVIEEGRSGYTVPALDCTALADRVLDLLDHPARRAAMAAHGRNFVAGEFAAERMVERIDALYERHLLRRGLLQAAPTSGQ
jgi:glycosyltransferase involved in cell wall biosynthesis